MAVCLLCGPDAFKIITLIYRLRLCDSKLNNNPIARINRIPHQITRCRAEDGSTSGHWSRCLGCHFDQESAELVAAAADESVCIYDDSELATAVTGGGGGAGLGGGDGMRRGAAAIFASDPRVASILLASARR